MKKNITASKIAEICGVSQATVSYVLNNRTDKRISQKTREKVQKAIEEYHYVPNEAARCMRSRKCTSIGIVCAWDYSRQSFLNIMEGIGRYLDEKDYTLTLFYEKKDDHSPSYVKRYQAHLIDGLIYISNKEHRIFVEPAETNDIPYVVVCMDGVFSKNSPVPHAFDTALEECVLFCREASLKSIRYFSVDNAGVFVNDKYSAFSNIAQRLFPECDLEHIVVPVTHRSPENIAPAITAYLNTHEFEIAISHNYDIGLLIQREIMKKGMGLPQHPKNIFINDVDFYAITYPSITGITIPYQEMGRYAAQLILEILAGRESGIPYREFQCHLVHRQSTMLANVYETPQKPGVG